jgi:hypothetical protein
MARDYGITNAAPSASAPAVGLAGATYWNTTAKVLYVSDGTAWVAAGPADAPNGIATAKLNDGAVTRPKLAINAAYQGFWTAAYPLNFTVPAGAWTAVASVGVAPRGGLVLVWIVPSISSIPGTTATNRVVTALTRDASFAGGGAQLAFFTQLHAAAAGTRLPTPAALWTDTPTAGSHSYFINYFIDSGSMVTSADFPGAISALELS